MTQAPARPAQAEQLREPAWPALSSWLTLLASSGTLVCCALPALLVAIGAGAALSSLISVVPGLVWLSEYKVEVFAFAGLMLAASGVLQWRNRFAPCPIDPALRSACMRTRATSAKVYFASLAVYAIGGWFAFIQPLLGTA